MSMIDRRRQRRDLADAMGEAAEVRSLRERTRSVDDERLAGAFGRAAGTGGGAAEVELTAAAVESAARHLGQEAYDVQVAAAAALGSGRIVEMRTGEGKTLAAMLAAPVLAARHGGVHIVTANTYLAERDAAAARKVLGALGMTVGVTLPGDDHATRRRAWAADVTYTTVAEVGFDLLRDMMTVEPDGGVHRGLNAAIVDEADAVLIDEANVPLIISEAEDGDVRTVRRIATAVAPKLRRDEDYTVDEALRTVNLTDEGIGRAERLLRLDGDLYSTENADVADMLAAALKAKELMRRGREYLVEDRQVKVIDQETGRVLPGRRLTGGLHQAIEAKERVEVRPESVAVASITVQTLMRGYRHLSGMTGTAADAADELADVYGLKVVALPTHRPDLRVDHPDVIHPTKAAKTAAVVAEIGECRERRQPVLVATASVEASEDLSSALKKAGVAHRLLNATNPADEADVIAEAGREGAVTVATSIAGRGTDIVLGRDEEERRRILAAGGLRVIGAERHESRRVDEQLRGRCGRQGDPGETRFHLSFEDDLLRLFGTGVSALAGRSSGSVDVPAVGRMIRSAQRKVEALTSESRRRLARYDEVMERQRQHLSQQRRLILEGGEGTRRIADGLATRAGDTGAVEALASRLPDGTEEEILRKLMLDAIDRSWRTHVDTMEVARQGAGLQAAGGVDPVDAYRRLAEAAYREMWDTVATTFADVCRTAEVHVT